MEKDIIELTYELSDLISESEAYRQKSELEEKIILDLDLQALEKLFIAAQEHLVSLEDTTDEPTLKRARQKLSEIKYQLDVHPLMIEYNRVIKELNKIYDDINKEVFRKFVKQKTCKI